MRSISIDPAGNEVDLLLDRGDAPNIRQTELDRSSDALMRYFRVGLALPNSAFWVNLRPDAPDEIIDPYLERTDVGEILLKSDLMLKRDLARMTDPANTEGREYWDKLYAKAERLFGGEDMQIPMATRPWIVPGEIILRETGTGVYIYKAVLSVRMEQDYIKDSPFHRFDDPRLKALNEYSSKLLREKILPKLTREINSSKRYSELRQVFYSLVLAQWLKQRLAVSGERLVDGIGSLAVSVERLADSKDLSGLTSRKPWSKQEYYRAYRASFEQGEYNKEAAVHGPHGDTVCRYFSGGMNLDGGSLASAVIIKAGEDDTVGMLRSGLVSLKGRLSSFLSDNAGPGTARKEASDEDPGPLTGEGLSAAIEQVSREVVPNVNNYRLYDRLTESGVRVFGAYEGYLNENGLEVKSFFDEFSGRRRSSGFDWKADFAAFREHIALIPRLGGGFGSLHLELFEEVFDGMDEETIDMFRSAGIGTGRSIFGQSGVVLNLSEGCRNMCLLCGMYGTNDHPRFGKQMPFPMAVKVMRRLREFTHSIVPYSGSEPLDYYDEAVGATVTDVVEAAQSLNYGNISIVTHGVHGKNYDPGKVAEIIGRLSKKIRIGVSVHVFHGDVLGYAREVAGNPSGNDRLPVIREKIVAKYTEEFTALLKAAEGGKGVEIRVFQGNPQTEKILDPDTYAEAMRELGREPRVLTERERRDLSQALEAIRQIQSVQDEVWERVQQRVDLTSCELHNFRILWIGRAARFLRNRGVPEDIIGAMQEADTQKSNLSDAALDPAVNADGSLSYMISEDAARTLRRVGEVFPDPEAPEFGLFVNILRAQVMAKGDDIAEFIGPVIEDPGLKSKVLPDMTAYLGLSKSAAGEFSPGDFDVRMDYAHYIDAFMYLSFRDVRELLVSLDPDAHFTSAEKRRIHDAARDMPVMTENKFHVMFKEPGKFKNLLPFINDGFLNGYSYRHSFLNAPVQRHILEPYQRFGIEGFRAFRDRSGRVRDRSSGAGKDGGVTVPLAQAIGALASVSGGGFDYDAAFRDPDALKELVDGFSGNPQRMERLSQQAETVRQSVIEIVANAIDATLARQGVRSIGRFGIGAYQTLGLLNGPEDSVSWTTSVDGITGYRATIARKDGQFYLTTGIADEITGKGTVFAARVAGFQHEAYREHISRKFGLTTRMPVFVNGRLVNTLEDIRYINGDPLLEHEYPDSRVDVETGPGGFRVIDRGTGMSAQDILTRLLIPRAGVNQLPTRTLDARQIAVQTAMFYRMHEGKSLNEVRASHVSIQVAGVEIERVEAVGYNLPQSLVLELPADTVLTTERSFVQFDEQTREAVRAVVKKIISQGGEDTPALLNGVALLLRSWEKRNKQAESLVRDVRSMVRGWVEGLGGAAIVLPSQSELRRVDQDIDGVNYAPDGFYELRLPGMAPAMYLSDYLYAFDPAACPGFSRPAGWSSETGYELWTAPFKAGSTKVCFLHRGYAIVDRAYYELNAGNPAAIALLVNPNNDYVPESGIVHARFSYRVMPPARGDDPVGKPSASREAFSSEEYIAADRVLSRISLARDGDALLFHFLADIFRRDPRAVDEMEGFTGRLLDLERFGIIDQSDLGRLLQRRIGVYKNNRSLSLAILAILGNASWSANGGHVESVFRMLMENDRPELAMFLASLNPSWRKEFIKGAIGAGEYDLAFFLIGDLRKDLPLDAMLCDEYLAVAKAREGDAVPLLETMDRARALLEYPANVWRPQDAWSLSVLFTGMETLLALGKKDEAARYLAAAMNASSYSGSAMSGLFDSPKLGYVSRIIGQEEQAERLFSQARGEAYSAGSAFERYIYVTHLSKYLALSGKEADAASMLKSLFQGLRKAGRDVSLNENPAHYEDAVRAILAAGRFADVFELIEALDSSKSLKMLTFYLAAREAVRKGRIDEVMNRSQGEEDIFKAAVAFGKYRELFEAGKFLSGDVDARNELERAVSSLARIPRSRESSIMLKRFAEDASATGMYACAERIIGMMDHMKDEALMSLWSGLASRKGAENPSDLPFHDDTEDTLEHARGYMRDNAYYFSENPDDLERFRANFACFPPGLRGYRIDSTAPFLTFVANDIVFGLFDAKAFGQVADAVKGLPLSEQRSFFAFLNNIAPGQKPDGFSTVAAQWARLYGKLEARKDVIATLIDISARNGSAFVPGAGIEPDTADQSISMFVKYLRGDVDDILLEGESGFEQDRGELVLEHSANGAPLTLDMINNLFRKYPQDIRSVDTLAQFMELVMERSGDIRPEEAALQQEQIRKTIYGQDTSEYVCMRELVQNSRDAMRWAGMPGPIKVRSFITPVARERVVSVEDPVGMSLSTLLGPLFVIDETTKTGGSDASGMFGMGFYTVFAASDVVRIQTSSGDGKVFFVEIAKDPAGVFAVTGFEQRSGEYKGTRIESVRKPAEGEDPFLEAVFIADSLVRYCGAVRDADIEFNGRKIGDDLSLVGSAETAMGTLSLYTAGSMRQRVCSGQLYVESPRPEEYFALVPQEYRDMIYNRGFVVELPREVELTTSRKTVFDKEKNMPVIRKAVAAAVYQAVVHMFLYGDIHPVGLTQDYLSLPDESAGMIDPIVRSDAAAVNEGRVESVDFAKYVSTSLDPSGVRAKKNSMVGQLISLIKIRTMEGDMVALDDIRRQLRENKLKSFFGTGVAYESYVGQARELVSRDRNAHPLTRDEAASDARTAGFLRMAELVMDGFGLGGRVSVWLAEGGAAPAFFARGGDTVYFNVKDPGIQKLLDDAAASIAAGSARDMYDFYFSLLDMLSHEGAHYFAMSHERETNMDGVFGWHKARLLRSFILSGRNLDDLARGAGKDGGGSTRPAGLLTTDSSPRQAGLLTTDSSPRQAGLLTTDGSPRQAGLLTTGGSARTEDGGKGGIDFRALPVGHAVSAGSSVSEDAALRGFAGRAVIKDMDAEWASIILAAGKDVPWGRIKSFWAVSCASRDAQPYKQKVIAYIEQLLSWEEARAVDSSDELKDLLACIG